MSSTTRNRRLAIHTLVTLGLGLSLASSIVATTIVPSTASAAGGDQSDEFREFVEAALKYAAYIKDQSQDSYPTTGPFQITHGGIWEIHENTGEWPIDANGDPLYPAGSVATQLHEILSYAKMIEAASKLALEMSGTTHSITGSGTAADKAGRKAAINHIRQSAISAANAAHTMTLTILNSIAKVATSIPIWIDPTLMFPHYLDNVPENSYGAIMAADGMGYGTALILELAPGGGGYGYDYSTEDGYGYDGGGGGDYYSEESYDSGATASGTPSTTPETSTADDAGSCPTTDGEYSFDSIEQACSCPAVDYWYETETGEDGETTTTDSGMCSDIPSDAQSCVPNWRDWYNILETESGSRVAVPDMIYAIPSDSVRSEFFAALPVILSSMVDGDTLNLHYSESWLIGDSGLALSAPISSSMMLQTNAIDVADQELGIDAVLVSYTCSASPRALGGTMAPALLDGDMSLIDAGGVITDGSAVQAAIIDTVQ